MIAANGNMIDKVLIPDRLKKLMTRIASLEPGQAYTITLFLPEGNAEPAHVVTPLGKVENFRQSARPVCAKNP